MAQIPQQQGPLYPIQVIPPGLLGLLQLKQAGRLPDKLNDTVVPVIELRDWYLTARRIDEVSLYGGTLSRVGTVIGGLNLALPGPVPAPVPGNQIWWVEQYHVEAPTALVADVIRFAPAISRNGGAVFQQVGPDVANVVSARQTLTVGRADRGFWAYPGDLFAVLIFDISSAGITFTGRLRATPCPT